MIKENTHDIHLTVKAKECCYWNYENQTCRHTCRGCDDLPKGNTIDTVHYGVMIGGNRYCMLYCDVYGEIIKALEKESEEIKPDGLRAEVVIIDELSETNGGPFHETVLKGVLKKNEN